MESNDVFWNVRTGPRGYHHAERALGIKAGDLTRFSRLEVSKMGEAEVARLAARAGWDIVAQGLRGRGFELDLVLRRGTFVNIIEVKTRLFPKTPPEGALTSGWLNTRKLAAMRRGAESLLGSGKVSTRDHISFDLIGVDVGRDQWIRLYRWPNIL
jgi:Holliday junction resolvase-like predicted endonuclease